MMGSLPWIPKENRDDFQILPNGRLKCLLTSHEMLADLNTVLSHLSSKRVKNVKLGQSMKQFEPHVVQSTEHKDKLFCTLTAVTLSKNEDAVWKHMLGKRFQKALAKKEEEKKHGLKKLPETNAENLSTSVKGAEKKARKKEKKREKKDKERAEKLSKKLEQQGKADMRENTSESAESEPESADRADEIEDNSDHADFWMPPAGMRWDDDTGESRWKNIKKITKKNKKNDLKQPSNGHSKHLDKVARDGRVEVVNFQKGKGMDDVDFLNSRKSEKRGAGSAVGGRVNISARKKIRRQ